MDYDYLATEAGDTITTEDGTLIIIRNLLGVLLASIFKGMRKGIFERSN